MLERSLLLPGENSFHINIRSYFASAAAWSPAAASASPSRTSCRAPASAAAGPAAAAREIAIITTRALAVRTAVEDNRAPRAAPAVFWTPAGADPYDRFPMYEAMYEGARVP